MISHYNRRQLLAAVFLLLAGVFCCMLAALFFYFVPMLTLHRFNVVLPSYAPWGIAALGLVALCVTGYQAWRHGEGFQSYADSCLFHPVNWNSGMGNALSLEVHKATGPAWFLSQLFLAGPLLMLRAADRIRSRIPNEPSLERRMTEALSALRQANRWQSIVEYPRWHDEILYLARMGKIDFSTQRGTPRVKACRAGDAV